MIPKLTETLINEIASYVRSGSFPEIAAEAHKVPRDVFHVWMARGKKKKANKLYRLLVMQITEAAAQARAAAETKAFQENPKEWLKSGPGRERPNQVGWTSTVKPQDQSKNAEADALLQASFAELCQKLLRILDPFPEIRLKVAEVLAQKQFPETS